ncbi:hypothetical protein ACSFBF_25190 [Variovorax sp. ZT5P49]|uniref:hypothetical protein n=1 Tax=Variovorax sp. ZT5P49 TaxID=3443733 RepID=UPI003F48834B
MELKAREGLMGLFHAGVTWRAFACLVSLTASITVETEKSLKIGRSRFVPDLIVRCVRTHRILLVVEVWHTHTVSAKKKAAYQAAGFPWVEVRSWHVISRVRRQPLPVLDWAGSSLPRPPQQHSLFNAEGDWAFDHRRHPTLDESTKESGFIVGRPLTSQERETFSRYRESIRLGRRFDPV